MRGTIARGLGHWRRHGTRVFLKILLSKVRRTLIAPVLRVRPRRVSDRQLARALGTSISAALDRATDAQPPLAALDRSLREDGGDEELRERADAICEHRFDLLGASVQFGSEIDWQRDPGSGLEWPMRHRSTMPRLLGAGSDIRRVWELGRMQHLPFLAVAWRRTGDQRYLDEIGAQLRSFAGTQPVEFGPQWACPMDVSIRAANIVAALCLVRSAQAEWLDLGCRLVLLHGRFVRSNLEWDENRGNHYLADVVGLMAVAALFSGSDYGRDLATWSAQELDVELARQIYPDGGDFEASLYYHRLVAELFYWGLSTAERLAPGVVTSGWKDQLRAMADVTAACAPDVSAVPQIGDSDDARYVPLDEYGADPADHSKMFELLDHRPAASESRSFPDVGWHVLVAGELHVVVRCGLTGRRGLGGHCHNDQMGFVAYRGNQPLVCDPGTFAYTGDPEARDRFRSTAYHATLQLDGAEQNSLGDTSVEASALFVLPDRTQASLSEFHPGGERPSLSGTVHWDHLDSAAVHTRSISVDADGIAIVDRVSSEGAHALTWTFPLPPGTGVRAGRDEIAAELADGSLAHIGAAGCEAHVLEGEFSARYGVREPAPFIRFSRSSVAPIDEQRISLKLG